MGITTVGLKVDIYKELEKRDIHLASLEERVRRLMIHMKRGCDCSGGDSYAKLAKRVDELQVSVGRDVLSQGQEIAKLKRDIERYGKALAKAKKALKVLGGE
jgi:hypothetical protein